MKKLVSTFVLTTLLLCSFVFTASADNFADYSVLLAFPKEAEPGETISVTTTIQDISVTEGSGIYAASVFLYYDAEYLTPVSGSFKATVPDGWDKFDGTSTPGIWGLFTNFDGQLDNGAINDGDISFTVSFSVSKELSPLDTYLCVTGCEGTKYTSSGFSPLKTFDSTAYCYETLSITKPEVLVPIDDTFIIDNENGFIYSSVEPLTLDSFSQRFSYISGAISIKAFDYEITSENGKNIPNGAIISVYHELSGVTYSFTYYLKGDCDCNGIVDSTDLVIIKNAFLNNIPVEDHIFYAMDMEEDGSLSITDYIRLKKYFLSK